MAGVMRGAKPSIRCLASTPGSRRPVLWWGYATTPCRSSPPSSSPKSSSQRQQQRELPRRDMCTFAAPKPSSQSRKTLQKCLEFHGTGLHSGAKAKIVVQPAGPGHGIAFQLPCGTCVPASWANVIDTSLSTTLASPPQSWEYPIRLKQKLRLAMHRRRFLSGSPPDVVSTVEHLLAALSGERVDDALILVSSYEVPIMDGSSLAFSQALKGATCGRGGGGIRVVKHVEVCVGGDRKASLSPNQGAGQRNGGGGQLTIEVSVDFGERLPGGHQRKFSFERSEFAERVAAARTFCFEEDLQAMRGRGLAKGGSLDNALVFRGGVPINEGRLRFDDEVARHKALDALGDLMLGGHIIGAYSSVKPGHAINHALLAKLFSCSTNYEIVT